MRTILGIPPSVLFGRQSPGPINGVFYALMGLGLAVNFGLLNIVRFQGVGVAALAGMLPAPICSISPNRGPTSRSRSSPWS